MGTGQMDILSCVLGDVMQDEKKAASRAAIGELFVCFETVFFAADLFLTEPAVNFPNAVL